MRRRREASPSFLFVFRPTRINNYYCRIDNRNGVLPFDYVTCTKVVPKYVISFKMRERDRERVNGKIRDFSTLTPSCRLLWKILCGQCGLDNS